MPIWLQVLHNCNIATACCGMVCGTILVTKFLFLFLIVATFCCRTLLPPKATFLHPGCRKGTVKPLLRLY
jgi:hypothetical protein